MYNYQFMADTILSIPTIFLNYFEVIYRQYNIYFYFIF